MLITSVHANSEICTGNASVFCQTTVQNCFWKRIINVQTTCDYNTCKISRLIKIVSIHTGLVTCKSDVKPKAETIILMKRHQDYHGELFLANIFSRTALNQSAKLNLCRRIQMFCELWNLNSLYKHASFFLNYHPSPFFSAGPAAMQGCRFIVVRTVITRLHDCKNSKSIVQKKLIDIANYYFIYAHDWFNKSNN